MKDDSSLDFLPEDAKKNASEQLKKTQGGQTPEIKLVVPSFEKDGETLSKKKKSWWQRRKEKKAQKRQEKLRRKGETATQKAQKTQKKEEKDRPASVKPKLFETASTSTKVKTSEEKSEPQKVQEEKPIEAPQPAKSQKQITSMPGLRRMDGLVAKKVKKAESKRQEVQMKKDENPPKQQGGSLSFTNAPANEEGPKQNMHVPEKVNDESEAPTVNLVPDSARISENGQPWVLATIALLIVVAIWFVVAGIVVDHVNKVEKEVLAAQAEITQFDLLIKEAQSGRETAEKLQKQFTAVEGALNNHVYWSPFFENLEETTIPDVYYIRMNVAQTGTVTLRAIAKSYAAAARQIRVFEKTPSFAASVTVSEAVVELQPEALLPVPIVAFDVEIELAENLLKKDFSSEE